MNHDIEALRNKTMSDVIRGFLFDGSGKRLIDKEILQLIPLAANGQNVSHNFLVFGPENRDTRNSRQESAKRELMEPSPAERRLLEVARFEESRTRML